MATLEEVKKLAALARISLSDDELERFTQEFEAIISYVGQLEALRVPQDAMKEGGLRNVLREDAAIIPPGANKEKLVAQFPASAEATAGKPEDGVYLVVKQIISHD